MCKLYKRPIEEDIRWVRMDIKLFVIIVSLLIKVPFLTWKR